MASIGPGPHAAMLLGDLGADVVRIDRPGGPGPFGGTVPDQLMRSRRSVALDLKAAPDRDLALALVDRADVLIEGYRPPTGQPSSPTGPWRCRRIPKRSADPVRVGPGVCRLHPASTHDRARRASTAAGSKPRSSQARLAAVSVRTAWASRSRSMRRYVASTLRTPAWSLPTIDAASRRTCGSSSSCATTAVTRPAQRLGSAQVVAGQAHLPGVAGPDRLGE